MSEDSEKPNLNVKESETSVSENNSCKPGEKIKRNYCYICKVQCTAQKNLEAHEQGKKHLKNLSLLPGHKTKSKKVKKKVNPQEKGSPDQSRDEQRSKNRKKKNLKKNVSCCKCKKKVEINKVGNETKSRKIIFLSVPKDKKKRVQNKRILAELRKKRNSVNKNNSQKDTTLPATPEPNATDSAAYDNQNTDSSFDNTTKRKMNHPNYQKPKNRRYQYANPNYEERFSQYQNAKYSYSNNYENEGFEYNPRFHSNYSQWNDVHSRNISFPPYTNYHNYGHPGQHYSDAEYSSPFFSGNRGDAFNSRNSSGQTEYFPNNDFENSMHNSDQADNDSFKAYDEIRFRSNSTSSDNLAKSNRKTYVDNNSSSALPNQSAADKNESASESTNRDDAKRGEKKQMRSRSLSSSENFNGENRMKNKVKTVVDSDGATEEQRIRKWTDSLLDTGHNKISRLIHPSNYKEKAAVNHLITKFSKSKRKENLTRKLRSNSLGSTENNEDDVESVNLSSNSLTTDESEEVSMIVDETSTKQSSNFEQNRNSPKNNCHLKEVKSLKASLSNSDKRSSLDSSDLKHAASGSRKSVKKDSKCSEVPSSRKSLKGKNMEETLPNTSEMCSKRKKISLSDGNKEKKRKINKTPQTPKSPQRTNSSPELPPTRENSPNLISPENLKVTESVLACDKTLEIKNELFESSGINNSATTSIDQNSQNMPDQNFVVNSEFSVESLIQLFATGNVKVKEEFNDPVMDAIRGMNADELINACSNQPILSTNAQVQNKTPVDSNKSSSKNKPASETSPPDEDRVHLSPVIIGSTVVNEDPTPAAVTSSNISSNMTEPNNNSSTTNKSCKKAESVSENVNLSEDTKPKLPSHLDKLISELQVISSQEEKVKQNLCEAKSKISEYSSLLEEWKNKKKELQVEEECLRKQRNEIISQMQNAVKSNKDSIEEQESSGSQKNDISDESVEQTKNNIDEKQNLRDSKEMDKGPKNSCISKVSVTVVEKPKKIKTSISLELDEITILPPPVKEKPPVINILDDSEDNASVKKGIQSGCGELVTNVVSNNGSTMFDVRSVSAHTTIINCLVVFEDFLYTCSNDTTAKRFCLKDASLAVTYVHAAKNVVEIVVEKVQNEALVFTSCSARVISLFIASSGTKIKTFYPPCAVMSICKGWGKFYAGLENGSVNVYNWKYEEREVVKTESPASRIGTAHQGRLHVLVILSSDGHVAIRDAETGLLIRAIKVFVKHPSWMTVYNDLAYLSSSEKFIIVLDILTGRIEKRLYLNSYSTGIAVYEDYIFTISYNGIINCLNKDKICDKKQFYGAGKAGLTCVHVYQNWVFTGNRKGNVSLFQFDPNDSESCKFSKCDITYGSREDLEYHVENDHLSKKKSSILKCPWRGCECVFPKESDTDEKMDHLKKHIYPRLLL